MMHIRSNLREHWWKGISSIAVVAMAFVSVAAIDRHFEYQFPHFEHHLITIRADIYSLTITDTVKLDSLGIVRSYSFLVNPASDIHILVFPAQVRKMADKAIESMPENSRIEFGKHQKHFAFIGEWEVESFKKRIGTETFINPRTGSLIVEELNGEQFLAPVIDLDGSQMMDGERPIFLVLTFEAKKQVKKLWPHGYQSIPML